MNFKSLFKFNNEETEKKLRELVERENASGVVLSSKEKEEMRGRIHDAILASPVRNAEGQRPQLQRSFLSQINNIFLRPMTAAIVLALTVAIGGGGAFAAEQSLPGDLLYPVKVNVNEEVKGAVSFSDEARAEWATRRAERRLEEAEGLTVQSRIDSDTSAQLEARLQAHIEKANEIAARLEQEGHAEAAAKVYDRMETSLETHAVVLALLSADSDSGGDLANMISFSASEGRASAESRGRAEGKVTSSEAPQVEAAAEGRMNASSNKISEVESLINKMESRIGEDVVAEANARLEAAKELHAEAESHMEADAYAEAFRVSQESHRTAQEAKILVNTSSKLEVDMLLGPESRRDSDSEEESSRGRSEHAGPPEDRGPSENTTEEDTDVDIEVNGEGDIEADLDALTPSL